MKYLMLFTGLSLALGSQSCTQKTVENKAPEKVLSAFQSKFPEAQNLSWEKEKPEQWEANFQWKGQEYSANFKSNGEWVETEHGINQSEVPAEVRNILDQNIKEYELEEVEIAETPDGIAYEMELETGENNFEVVIDSQGNFSKKKLSTKDEEEED